MVKFICLGGLLKVLLEFSELFLGHIEQERVNLLLELDDLLHVKENLPFSIHVMADVGEIGFQDTASFRTNYKDVSVGLALTHTQGADWNDNTLFFS